MRYTKPDPCFAISFMRSLGVVSPAPDSLSRPTVRVISDTRGHLLFPGTLTDLSEVDAVKGGYVRTIIKIADPDRYGIRISDYFV